MTSSALLLAVGRRGVCVGAFCVFVWSVMRVVYRLLYCVLCEVASSLRVVGYGVIVVLCCVLCLVFFVYWLVPVVRCMLFCVCLRCWLLGVCC